MISIQPLLDRLAEIPGMEGGSKRLVVVLGQLGDFDSINCGGPLSAWTGVLSTNGCLSLFARSRWCAKGEHLAAG